MDIRSQENLKSRFAPNQRFAKGANRDQLSHDRPSLLLCKGPRREYL
jgi:hypothetical protein